MSMKYLIDFFDKFKVDDNLRNRFSTRGFAFAPIGHIPPGQREVLKRSEINIDHMDPRQISDWLFRVEQILEGNDVTIDQLINELTLQPSADIFTATRQAYNAALQQDREPITLIEATDQDSFKASTLNGTIYKLPTPENINIQTESNHNLNLVKGHNGNWRLTNSPYALT